ncbi:hypothetical protein OIU77_021708 [Salix suchowensis]|uniref:DYW domain-containing protein n=1 Tax=Salix suchowensis TaxID=1278906 RepID=A0ABQ9CE65_9ROSI|nr:hypothetical protein OIU77_021708 [Salix suchowensis]
MGCPNLSYSLKETRGFVKESVLRIENIRNHPFQANFETLNMRRGLDSQNLSLYKDGKKAHSFICSSGISIDSVLGSKLVFMYVTCGDLREGRLIFDKIRNEKVFLWNLMMNGYAKIGDFKESVYLFREMLDFGVEVNSHTVSCILKCFAALGSVKEGKWVHGFLLKLGFGSYNAVINSLIAFYLKIRRVDVARKLFDELSDRDVISWNSMISGYVANGFSEKGVELFKKMLYLGVDVDLATMVSILQACANCGDVFIGKGSSWFWSEGQSTLENYILQYITGYLMLEKVSLMKPFDCFVKWTGEGVSPDIFTITTVLHACACNGSLENGKDVHELIRENDMGSNIFVCNALMDISHPQAKKIEVLLKRLRSKMKEEDSLQKETALCGHSEKLAMAFGIMNLPPGRTIRVSKNLRVCADCHEMAKFISKTTGREIVLRDSNRFHHFKDGVCCCRGFW